MTSDVGLGESSLVRGTQRFFRDEPSKGIAFPHPKSRHENDRKEDILKIRAILLNFRGRTVHKTDERKGKDNVNPVVMSVRKGAGARSELVPPYRIS